MELRLTVGDTYTIPARDVMSAMLGGRDKFFNDHGLSQGADPSPANKVQRADIHPRLLAGQEDVPHGSNVVSAEVTDGGVVVTAKAPGHASVHVIDEASAPAAVEYEFFVARKSRADEEVETITVADVGEMPAELLP